MRSEEVERRLLNWARWLIGGRSGGLGYVTVSYGPPTSSAAVRESIIPTSEAEAMETDDQVKLLAEDVQKVVGLHYQHGMSVAAISVRLCCSTATVYGRLDRAHRQLDAAFADMAETRRAERARVELIATQARRVRGF